MTEEEVKFKIFDMLVGECADALSFEDFVIIAKQARGITGIVLYGNEAAAISVLESMKEPAQ